MTKEQIIEMYIRWKTGADDELKMSDWLCACFDADIDEDEVEKTGDAIIKREV